MKNLIKSVKGITHFLFLIFVVSMLLISCVSVKEIGHLNMVSTRNIETNQHYVLLKTYVTLSPDELKNTRANSIESAIDKIVKKVGGGEYLMNAKVYSVNHGSGKHAHRYYAVEGDVWGVPNMNK